MLLAAGGLPVELNYSLQQACYACAVAAPRHSAKCNK